MTHRPQLGTEPPGEHCSWKQGTPAEPGLDQTCLSISSTEFIYISSFKAVYWQHFFVVMANCYTHVNNHQIAIVSFFFMKKKYEHNNEMN